MVGGMSWGLAQGERKIGLHSEVLVLFENWHRYPADRVIFKRSQESLIMKCLGCLNLFKNLYEIRKNFDVFHFNFGSSLIDFRRLHLHLIDLPLYKGKGKIVVTYNGCDARQKYPTIRRVSFSACHQEDCYNGICKDRKRDEMKRFRIAKFDHYADALFAVNPDLLYFLPERTKFLPYAIADWDEIETLSYKKIDKRLRIVHSPTNRAAKGSEIIIQSLERLKKRYGDFIEVLLVEGLPYRKARQVYTEADLAIDQILIGWYGGFAVELMKMGKPVLSFIREEDLRFIPKEMAKDCQEALILAEPSTLDEKLLELVENPDILLKHSEAGLDYVYKWHDPAFVGKITKSVYES
jgi:hypothetical protein